MESYKQDKWPRLFWPLFFIMTVVRAFTLAVSDLAKRSEIKPPAEYVEPVMEPQVTFSFEYPREHRDDKENPR